MLGKGAAHSAIPHSTVREADHRPGHVHDEKPSSATGVSVDQLQGNVVIYRHEGRAYTWPGEALAVPASDPFTAKTIKGCPEPVGARPVSARV